MWCKPDCRYCGSQTHPVSLPRCCYAFREIHGRQNCSFPVQCAGAGIPETFLLFVIVSLMLYVLLSVVRWRSRSLTSRSWTSTTSRRSFVKYKSWRRSVTHTSFVCTRSPPLLAYIAILAPCILTFRSFTPRTEIPSGLCFMFQPKLLSPGTAAKETGI